MSTLSIGCYLLFEYHLISICFCQLSLGDARAYFLSTAKNELGVVSAESIAGEILLIFWELNPYKWLWLQFVASSLQYVNVSDLRDCFFFFFIAQHVIASLYRLLCITQVQFIMRKISVFPFSGYSGFSSACFSLGRDTIKTKSAFGFAGSSL